MTDMFWLGKLGRVEVAAPSVSWPIIGLLLSIGDGFVVAGFALVTFLPFFGVYSAVTDVFQSSGHTRNELILSTLRLWGLRLPLGYGLGVLMHDTSGLWLGMGLSNLFSVVIAFAWFMKGTWTRKIIDN
ncbi:hypothetical protein [Thermococcus aciditolerans]|uniref:hypothetical protein n=1 Tax=Thermococcus aciditolerans TaxID=2598455 RepID=UPI00319E1C46